MNPFRRRWWHVSPFGARTWLAVGFAAGATVARFLGLL